jgi:GT2 family glycosyltransferase
VVRAKNKEKTIELTLRGLRDQTVETEIILVDSGSTDRTIEIARPYCDQILSIPAEEFSYGGALNLGAQQATGDVVFALSAHCVPPTPQWVEWALQAYADERVAGTFGSMRAPDGTSLIAPTKFVLADLKADPTWGFSNHASSWRRSAWREFPFNDKLVACEDKEWMWRVLGTGLCVVADPRLVVDARHRRQAGVIALYGRMYREHLVLAELLDYPRLTVPTLLRRWWSELPNGSPRPLWQRRLSPWRAVELLGEFTGDRAGARRRGEHTHSTSSWGQAPDAPANCTPA